MARVLFAIALSSALASCGGHESVSPGSNASRLCDAETRSDPFQIGLEKVSDGGTYSARLVAHTVEGLPGPPDRGDNTLTLEVLGSDGLAIENPELLLRPWMPDHGHGTTPLLHRGERAGDNYSFGPFFLHMGGYWELGLNITDGEEEDSLMFGFCVEG